MLHRNERTKLAYSLWKKMCYLKSYIQQLVTMITQNSIQLAKLLSICFLFCLNPLLPFQGDSLLLTTKSLGVLGTLLIDLTMKQPSDFEPTKLGLVIGKHVIISLLLHSTKRCIKDLEYKLNMVNKTSASYKNFWLLQQGFVMSCNGLLIWLPNSNKNSPHSNLKLPSR